MHLFSYTLLTCAFWKINKQVFFYFIPWIFGSNSHFLTGFLSLVQRWYFQHIWTANPPLPMSLDNLFTWDICVGTRIVTYAGFTLEHQEIQHQSGESCDVPSFLTLNFSIFWGLEHCQKYKTNFPFMWTKLRILVLIKFRKRPSLTQK